jgi:AraC-like DNA-binding protein
LRVFMAHADELLEAVVADRSFEARVRLVILDNLIPNGAGASHIARQLCMSVSTLKRRLKEHNFNYRSLRERTIIDLACKALSSTDSSISNIALKLGYSELSAFDRAFSKATGLAPRAYRQSKRQ